MTAKSIHIRILCASEFSLAIALTVFVALTVILATLLIALGVSKNFRAVFFGETKKKKKSAKKQPTEKPSEPDAQQRQTVSTDTQDRPRRTPARRSKASNEPEYLDAIPTVPLIAVPTQQASPAQRPARGSRIKTEQTNGVPTAAARSAESGSSYTPRSITITRARTSSRGDGAHVPSSESGDKQTDPARKR